METRLVVEIKNSKPMELLELTKSLVALGNQFSDYVSTYGNSKEIKEAKLYVKEIRTGSVIIELVELISPAILPFVENTNTIVDFAKHFKDCVGKILNNKLEDNEIKPQTLKDIAQILNPIAHDSSSQFNLSTNVQGDINFHLHVDSNDSNAIQNIVLNKIRQSKVPLANEEIESKLVLTLYQARNDLKSIVGNKGIIEAISTKPVNIIFENEIDKESIFYEENPFTTAFVVDIKAMYANNKIVAYKIVKLHERFELE